MAGCSSEMIEAVNSIIEAASVTKKEVIKNGKELENEKMHAR
jgi:hypothetical protein